MPLRLPSSVLSLLLSVPLCSFSAAPAHGTLRLAVQPLWGNAPMDLQPSSGAGAVSITRLDWLVSQLELQRADGSWLATVDWSGFFSAQNSRLTADATGVPKEAFRALRFTVGLDARTNALTPDTFGVGHPLRAAVDTMHWGWMGGFIFMAVEGRSPHGAFSYHLANDANATTVTVPVEFTGGGPVTITLSLDVQALLREIDFSSAPNSSHSREGDVIAPRLRTGIARAFRVVDVSTDLFQPVAASASRTAVPGTLPVSLRVPQRFPQLLLSADNPLTEEGMALGARLFHDTRLSINGTQSCASCHDRAHALADPRRFSVGAEGQQGKRNAMALFNLAWHDGFFWDGRARTLREQVLMPIQDAAEMHETLPRVVAKLAADKRYQEQFRAAFGDGEITDARVAMALEQHLHGQTSVDSKFDRAVRKVETLTPSENRGLQLFVTEHDPARGLRGADCFHCHGGMLFTDHSFHNNGLKLAGDDIGRAAVTKNAADRGKFKAPSLRNIALTAPYMHDGRFGTLEEVIEHYNSGVVRSETLDPNLAKHPEGGLALTAQEKADLAAFLRTLTDPALLPAASSLSQSDTHRGR